MSFFSRMKSRARKIERMVLPLSWMPRAPMRRIHLHWTAGSHTASSLDKEHYHFLVTFEGGKAEVVRGHLPVDANIPPLREGSYAAHTRTANSYAIGIGICAMSGAKTNPLSGGKYPVTQAQWDTAVSLIAALAHRYKIPVTEKTILTHAEVQPNLGIRQRGKWDISWLPFWKKALSAKDVGDKLRAEVKALV